MGSGYVQTFETRGGEGESWLQGIRKWAAANLGGKAPTLEETKKACCIQTKKVHKGETEDRSRPAGSKTGQKDVGNEGPQKN